jgi:hypothetical protein
MRTLHVTHAFRSDAAFQIAVIGVGHATSKIATTPAVKGGFELAFCLGIVLTIIPTKGTGSPQTLVVAPATFTIYKPCTCMPARFYGLLS